MTTVGQSALCQPPGNTPHEQAARSRQTAATDREIDQLVYEVYGLTDDEIRIAEEKQRRFE